MRRQLIIESWRYKEGQPLGIVTRLLWFAKIYYRKNLILLTIKYNLLQREHMSLLARYDGVLRDVLKQTDNKPTLTDEEKHILLMIASGESRKEMLAQLGITYPTLSVRLKALERKKLLEINGRKLTLTKK